MKQSFLVSLLFLTLAVSLASCSMFRSFIHSSLDKKDQNDFIELKEAHYFTEHLEKKDFENAKNSGLVNLKPIGDEQGKDKLKAYAGYFKVNKECNSNLYTFFFKHENPNAPVLLWLQGGPGASSLFGLFTEVGPYYVDKDLKLKYRDIAWTNDYSVIFVDQPVGTGFSFTEKKECYARDQNQVSKDLFTLLQQFFTVFSELKNNEFYITGESYAGKYIPSLAYRIHQNQKIASKFMNFTGIAIGNGFTDPINQMGYDRLLYQIGLIDENQKAIMKMKQQSVAELIKQQKWLDAFDGFNTLIDSDLGTVSMYTNFTGMVYYFNYWYSSAPKDQGYYEKYLNQAKIRELINVGNHTFNDGSEVETHMKEDIPKSVTKELVEIIRNYKVLIYNGQYDIIVAPILTENFLAKLDWEGVKSYLNAPRKIWKVNKDDEQIAGYVKSVFKRNSNQFHQVVVRNGGHMIPYDQPRSTMDMLNRFIRNTLHKV